MQIVVVTVLSRVIRNVVVGPTALNQNMNISTHSMILKYGNVMMIPNHWDIGLIVVLTHCKWIMIRIDGY